LRKKSSPRKASAAAIAPANAQERAAGGEAPTFEGAGFTCAEGDLRSSGSTAQGKVMEQWISDFNALCNANINAYGGGGSGKGIADFIANQVDFAGSDSALKEDQAAAAKTTRCAGNDALNLPMVTGPIALAYNISGVDSLTLTPSVLAGIFNGKITNWNDPAIAALNSGVTLPALGIQAVHRAEDSGTTENFTKYLKAAAPSDWTIDPSKSWTAPGGVAAQGSDGVAKQVKSTDGSIGYVEWGFAIDDGLNVAQIEWLDAEPASPVPDECGYLVRLLQHALPQFAPAYDFTPVSYEDASWVGMRLVEILPLPLPEKQRCLEMRDPQRRLDHLRMRVSVEAVQQEDK